jgi:hypothetical protein
MVRPVAGPHHDQRRHRDPRQSRAQVDRGEFAQDREDGVTTVDTRSLAMICKLPADVAPSYCA